MKVSYIVLSIYQASSTDKKLFINDMSSLLHDLTKCTVPIIFLPGDINIYLMENTHVTIEYLDTLERFGSKQGISLPTRIKENTSTLLDHIIFNYPTLELEFQL